MSQVNEQMTWFEKSSTLGQSIVTMPMIGPISAYQAIIIFGVGLSTMFIVMQATNSIAYAVAPFIAFTIFAMIRPPVMSYESRLLSNLQFMLFGPKSKKKKSKKTKSEVLVMPTTDLEEEEIEEVPVEEEQPMQVFVNPNTQVEVAITLRNNQQVLGKTKAWIFIDGIKQKTTMSNSSGEVRLLLDSAECIGKKEIVIYGVKADMSPGDRILSKAVEFIQK